MRLGFNGATAQTADLAGVAPWTINAISRVGVDGEQGDAVAVARVAREKSRAAWEHAHSAAQNK